MFHSSTCTCTFTACLIVGGVGTMPVVEGETGNCEMQSGDPAAEDSDCSCTLRRSTSRSGNGVDVDTAATEDSGGVAAVTACGVTGFFALGDTTILTLGADGSTSFLALGAAGGGALFFAAASDGSTLTLTCCNDFFFFAARAASVLELFFGDDKEDDGSSACHDTLPSTTTGRFSAVKSFTRSI